MVFGCGGNRDKEKRAIMGKIAKDYADLTIITDDNPRDEDSATIRAEIIRGNKEVIEIADRRKAIKYAIAKKQENDILLVAGKGDEEYQIIKNEKKYFSDREEIKKYFLH